MPQILQHFPWEGWFGVWGSLLPPYSVLAAVSTVSSLPIYLHFAVCETEALAQNGAERQFCLFQQALELELHVVI